MNSETIRQDPEALEYTKDLMKPIYQWACERYMKTKQCEFRISECKEQQFKTITDCYLSVACELLAEEKKLLIDNKSRIVKYTLLTPPNLLRQLQRDQQPKDSKPQTSKPQTVTKKRKVLEEDEESDEEEEEDDEMEEEESKENRQAKQPKKKQQKTDHPLEVKRVLTEKKKDSSCHSSSSSFPSYHHHTAPLPASKKFDVEITVTDLPPSQPLEPAALLPFSSAIPQASFVEFDQMKTNLTSLLRDLTNEDDLTVDKFLAIARERFAIPKEEDNEEGKENFETKVKSLLQTLHNENKLMLEGDLILL